MHLTLISPDHANAADTRSIDVCAPGITIGSAQENDWTPARDTHELSPFQAAIRVEDGVHTLVNLASRLPVTVNGVALACHADVQLHAGDDIALGACRIAATEAAATSQVQAAPHTSVSASAATAAPPAAAAIAATAAPLDALEQAPSTAPSENVPVNAPVVEEIDPFADLLGPGTLPLGAPPVLDTTHPFDMGSAAPRNAADPLAGWAQRPDAGQESRTHDPLALFDEAQTHDVPDVFTDHTPSVLERGERTSSGAPDRARPEDVGTSTRPPAAKRS